MAGIYIHVPFCSKRCTYCDFFSSTNMQNKETYVDSVVKELELRKEYLSGEGIGTIYFGGGTPSQLDIRAFERIFETISRLYQIDEDAEITLEANPDDMTPGYVEGIATLPFNRVSMGVQSFKDEDLHFLNRRHDSRQAFKAIALCKENGLINLSDVLEDGRRVVLYFYPAAMTPGCTTEACDFRDNLARLESQNVAVLGVSKDSLEKLRKFAEHDHLTFPLLSDPDLTVHKLYGAYGEKKLYGKIHVGVIRSTLVINPDGSVALARYNVRAKGHVDSLLKALEKLEKLEK